MITKKAFVGIEAEGPHRGQKTLFIPGSLLPTEFVVASMMHGKEVERVYFGAGEDRNLNGFTLAAIANCFPAKSITIEVDEVGDLWPCFNAHYTIVSHNPLDIMERANFYKKVEDGVVSWIDGPGIEYVTSVNDPLFAQDKEIEE